MNGRDLSNEDIVTDILVNREILKRSDAPDRNGLYTTNPNYDLTNYLNTNKYTPSRFGPKYIFVK